MPYPDVLVQLLLAISFCNPTWLQQLKLGYEDDAEAVKILHNPTGDYSVQDGIIRHRSKVWLGHNKTAQQHVLQAVHNSAVGGHARIQATYYRIRNLFSWPGMKADIYAFVQQCQVCQ